jgi:hypothetical protein
MAKATSGRADSAVTFGEAVAEEITTWSPVQKNPTGIAAIASMGFAATLLLLQERLIALTGEEMRGQALGLHATGMKAMQAIGATLAGVTAQFLPVGAAMTTLAQPPHPPPRWRSCPSSIPNPPGRVWRALPGQLKDWPRAGRSEMAGVRVIAPGWGRRGGALWVRGWYSKCHHSLA